MGTRSLLFTILTSLISRPWPQVDSLHLRASDATDNCRYLPGDTEWPTSSTWAKLNTTVGGRLIQTDPLASVCHGSSYNEEQCESLKVSWEETLTQ